MRIPSVRAWGFERSPPQVLRKLRSSKGWELSGLSAGALPKVVGAGARRSARTAPQLRPLLQPQQKFASGRKRGKGPFHGSLILAEALEKRLQAASAAGAEPLHVALTASLTDLQSRKRKRLRNRV